MESPQRYAADERDASPASVSSRVRLLIPEPLCEAQDQGSVPSSTGSAGNDGGAENNGSADSNRGWESSSLLHRRPQKQPANGPQSSALAAGRAGPPRLSNISDADSSRSANTVGSFLHDDVCYSPYGSGQAIDYGALGEYVTTGEVDPHHRRAAPSRQPHWFSKRRDSKGFTGGKPSFSELGRFTFYSRACGAIHSEKFAQLFDELPPTENGTETNSQKSGKQSIVDIMKAGDFWLDVTSPTVSEMKAFAKIFGIHPLTVEDIQMEEDREKCESFPHYYFVCLRTFDQDRCSPTFMRPLVYYIVVMQEGVLSFHFARMPHAHNVCVRIDQLKHHMPVTPDWICYALIDDIADSFGPLIRQLEAEVVSIDELVLILRESEQSDMLQRIGHARRNVMGLLRLLNAKPDVIRSLRKRLENSDVGLYFGDIQDHILSMLSGLNYYEGILGRAHSNYLAQISIEITQSSNHTNVVLTKITIMGSILVPMNVVTGLWGMNGGDRFKPLLVQAPTLMFLAYDPHFWGNVLQSRFRAGWQTTRTARSSGSS